MSLPKIKNYIINSATLGIALATSAIAPSFAGNDNDATAAPLKLTQERYEEIDDNVRAVEQAPTDDRPYYLAEFNASTYKNNPDANPLATHMLNGDKIVILNFYKLNSATDLEHTKEIEDTLSKLSTISNAKKFMLVNVVAEDENTKDIGYKAAYFAYYQRNNPEKDPFTLGSGALPYAQVHFEDLNDSSKYKSFDFSLFNGGDAEPIKRANLEGFQDILFGLVYNYNQRLGKRR